MADGNFRIIKSLEWDEDKNAWVPEDQGTRYSSREAAEMNRPSDATEIVDLIDFDDDDDDGFEVADDQDD